MIGGKRMLCSVQFKCYLVSNYQMQATFIKNRRLKKTYDKYKQPIQDIFDCINFYTFSPLQKYFLHNLLRPRGHICHEGE